MASYDYKCQVCEIVTTVSRDIMEADPGYNCTECGLKLIRVFSAPAAVKFVGGGFYSTGG